MGDPAGVGPEVLLKSYKKARAMQNLVAISDFDKIKSLAERYDVPLRKINHKMEKRNMEKFKNLKANTKRYENSAVPYMRRQLNKEWKKLKSI